jgi:dolichyl-phosphate-mannose--protein O-mannosyl transferase
MSEETTPLAGLTDAALETLLKNAIRDTLLVGLVSAAVLLFVSGWRNAAMLVVGVAISAASILEWRRLVRFVNAKLDKQKVPKSTVLVVVSFVLKLTVFVAVIYGSLKCFHGSVVALLCGLGLAFVTLAWGALKLLRDL